MNYLKEVIAFERWLETNPMPIESQLIWYRMIAIFNRSGWMEWVTLDNRRFMSIIGFSEKEHRRFYYSRDLLVKYRLVDHIKGVKGRPTKYKLLSFDDPMTGKIIGDAAENENIPILENSHIAENSMTSISITKNHIINSTENSTKKRTENSTDNRTENSTNNDCSFICVHNNKDINETKQNINKKNNITAPLNIPKDLSKAFTDFSEHRKRINKPLEYDTAKLLLEKLESWGYTDIQKTECLYNSIMNGWSGIFELKYTKSRNSVKDTNKGEQCKNVVSDNNISVKHTDNPKMGKPEKRVKKYGGNVV